MEDNTWGWNRWWGNFREGCTGNGGLNESLAEVSSEFGGGGQFYADDDDSCLTFWPPMRAPSLVWYRKKVPSTKLGLSRGEKAKLWILAPTDYDRLQLYSIPSGLVAAF